MSYKLNSRKKLNENDFQSAFSKADQAIKSSKNNHYNLVGGSSSYDNKSLVRFKNYDNSKMEQSGGAQVEMKLKTVLDKAKTKNADISKYCGSATGLYMRGDIKGNTLNISLITPMLKDEHRVTSNADEDDNEDGFGWKQSSNNFKSDHFHHIDIMENENIYSQQQNTIVAAVDIWITAAAGAAATGGGDAGGAVARFVAYGTGATTADASQKHTYAEIKKHIDKQIADKKDANTAFVNPAGVETEIKKFLKKNSEKFNFYQNSMSDHPLISNIPAFENYTSKTKLNTAANNFPGPAFKTRDFLIVTLTDTKVYYNSQLNTLDKSNMTEQIINYLLHQLVQYRLAKTILCEYDSNTVTKITVNNQDSFTSYLDFTQLRFSNLYQENVFSQCFQHNNLIEHAVTYLEPSDSSINMKHCLGNNVYALCNLTKALAISDLNTKTLNEESIFYLALRIRNFNDVNNLVVAQQGTDNDRFFSGSLGESTTDVNAAEVKKVNDVKELSVMFNNLGNGSNVDLSEQGKIGRFLVNPKSNQLMVYESATHANTPLYCLNIGNSANNNCIQPYRAYNEHMVEFIKLTELKAEADKKVINFKQSLEFVEALNTILSLPTANISIPDTAIAIILLTGNDLQVALTAATESFTEGVVKLITFVGTHASNVNIAGATTGTTAAAADAKNDTKTGSTETANVGGVLAAFTLGANVANYGTIDNDAKDIKVWSNIIKGGITSESKMMRNKYREKLKPLLANNEALGNVAYVTTMKLLNDEYIKEGKTYTDDQKTITDKLKSVLMPNPTISFVGNKEYKLTINIKAAGTATNPAPKSFENVYDDSAHATINTNKFAMHISTVSTCSKSSNILIKDALFL